MTVAELGRRLSARELTEWQAFFQIEAAAGEPTPKSEETQLRDLLDNRALEGLRARKGNRRP